MPGAIILPDTEAIAISYLLGITAITDLFGQRIGTELDLTGPAALPALRLTRISSPAELNHLRAGQTQFEVYADDNLTAQDGCELVRAHIHNDTPGLLVGVHAGLGVVTGVTAAISPRPQPDPSTGAPRWLFSANIYAHPIPT